MEALVRMIGQFLTSAEPDTIRDPNGEDTSGDCSRVVGDAGIAFADPGRREFTVLERCALLDLARKTLTEVVASGRVLEVKTNEYPKKLQEAKGCFVTLKRRRRLRGCMGNITPQAALCQAVIENARLAATLDPRFPPVQPEELCDLKIEISILTEPRPLRFDSGAELLEKLRPHHDGVVLQIGERRATYLPQVWAQLPDKTRFMNRLSEKAGCAASAWRQPGAAVATYEVESFGDAEEILR